MLDGCLEKARSIAVSSAWTSGQAVPEVLSWPALIASTHGLAQPTGLMI